MATLHIVNTPAESSSALTRCLYAASPGDAVLLIGNGIYSAVAASFPRHRPKHDVAWFVLRDDVRARGMTDRLANGIVEIDDDGFVDLVAAHQPIVSWSA
jgi:sulfur relay protein TusB/DsrH